MSDLTIKNILQKDIERKINGVVKADSNEKDTVITELNEYVVTEEIRKRLMLIQLIFQQRIWEYGFLVSLVQGNHIF